MRAFADALGTRFGLLGEETHRHGNHGEDTWGQQCGQSQTKPEQERPKESFFAFLLAFLRRATFAKHAFLAAFATVCFAGVVAPMLWLGTIIGTLGLRLDV